MAGNERFAKGTLLHPNRGEEARVDASHSQKPFAIILGCSDSRASPEILFDQGIGDLFIVRVAGNILSRVNLASIEYAALYLGSSILMVLGHENCGAVQAVIEGKTKDIEPIAEFIAPAIAQAHEEKGSLLVNSIKANVQHVVKELQAVPVMATLIQNKKIKVVGGYYNFHSGHVELLP